MRPFQAAGNDFNAAFTYAILRAVQNGATWKNVWGADAGRVVRVAAGQNGYAGRNQFILGFTAGSYGGDPSKFSGTAAQNVDVLATAPYFGYPVPNTFTLDQLFAEINSGGVAPNGYAGGMIKQALDYAASDYSVARAAGLPLVAYEGGQTLVDYSHSDLVLQNLYATANRDPRMGAAYTNFFNGWKQSWRHFVRQLYSFWYLQPVGLLESAGKHTPNQHSQIRCRDELRCRQSMLVEWLCEGWSRRWWQHHDLDRWHHDDVWGYDLDRWHHDDVWGYDLDRRDHNDVWGYDLDRRHHDDVWGYDLDRWHHNDVWWYDLDRWHHDDVWWHDLDGPSGGTTTTGGSTPTPVPPTVAINSPGNGTLYRGNGAVNIAVAASNPTVQIASISISIDNSTISTCANTTACSFSWPGKKVSQGTHTVSAIAVDAAGQSASTSVTITALK